MQSKNKRRKNPLRDNHQNPTPRKIAAHTTVIHWKWDREAAAITGPATARNMWTEVTALDAIDDGKSQPN